MVEEHTETVNELVVSDVPIGVPEGTFEGVFADGSLAYVEDLLPGRVSVVSCGQVVNWDFWWSEKKSFVIIICDHIKVRGKHIVHFFSGLETM